jgi:HEAT repeat protein
MAAIRPDQLVHTVIRLSAAAFAGSVSLSIAAVTRRLKRERYSKALDLCHKRIESILGELLDETLDYSTGLALLRDTMQNGSRRMAERVLFERPLSPKVLPLLRKLAEDLDLVRAWQSHFNEPASEVRSPICFLYQTLLRRVRIFAFLARARNADRLGRVRHRASWELLARALNDPSGDVQAVAVRALANIREPESFPFLVDRVRAATLSPAALSDRELTTALSQFPMQLAPQLLPLLQEANPRPRQIAVDTLREMAHLQLKSRKQALVAANQFDPEVTHWVLHGLPEDENANVRAATADLLGYFIRKGEARQAIVRLMQDRVWYVRLHAVRAAGNQFFGELVLPLSHCLTDSQWRVREAAASALASGGKAGVHHLFQILLTTHDAYAREQIVETLEASGVLADLVSVYGKAGHDLETRVLDAVSKLGRTEVLPDKLSKGIEHKKRTEAGSLVS